MLHVTNGDAAADRIREAGASDAVALNGIDRWWGGVHRRGADAAWRWDERSGRLSGPRS